MDAQQLSQVESLCETLYLNPPCRGENGEQIDRKEAESRLLSLQTSADFIPQCQYILDHSTSQYAKVVASNSLTRLITTHWNNFTVPQRVDIRNYILAYLANQGPALQDFVVASIIQLVCRITKLGWFDDPTHRELADDVTKFLQATVDHCILGLKILNQLVDELNIPTTGRTLTQHRKTSVSFRDVCLFKVFQLGLTTLKQLQTRTIGRCCGDFSLWNMCSRSHDDIFDLFLCLHTSFCKKYFDSHGHLSQSFSFDLSQPFSQWQVKDKNKF